MSLRASWGSNLPAVHYDHGFGGVVTAVDHASRQQLAGAGIAENGHGPAVLGESGELLPDALELRRVGHHSGGVVLGPGQRLQRLGPLKKLPGLGRGLLEIVRQPVHQPVAQGAALGQGLLESVPGVGEDGDLAEGDDVRRNLLASEQRHLAKARARTHARQRHGPVVHIGQPDFHLTGEDHKERPAGISPAEDHVVLTVDPLLPAVGSQVLDNGGVIEARGRFDRYSHDVDILTVKVQFYELCRKL